MDDFSRTICVMTLLRDFFTAKPTHSCAVFTLWVYIPNPPPPVLPFESLLPLNTYPKEIAGSDITNCLTHTMYAVAFKAA